MNFQDKFAEFARTYYTEDKILLKFEDADTYDYIIFLCDVLGIDCATAFSVGIDYNTFVRHCGPITFGRETVAAAFIHRYTGMSKYKLCQETGVTVSNLERMLRKIHKEIMQNKYLFNTYTNGGWS
jgi:hypothetical protein